MNQKNKAAGIDSVIKSRRSIRSFTSEIPPKEFIEQIIESGLAAPHAAQAVEGQRHFRRFFVVMKESKSVLLIKEMMMKRAAIKLDELRRQLEATPELFQKSAPFLKRLEFVSKNGIPAVGAAPYYIVVAEKKGIPPVEQQSLAHCLQNMWLKATDLGLGFQLVSMTAEMGKDKDFCDLLHIPFGEFELNGCALGYPKDIPPERKNPSPEEVTEWFE
jgi:nitroreductase